jgi:hypothetical protein
MIENFIYWHYSLSINILCKERLETPDNQRYNNEKGSNPFQPNDKLARGS